jgi:hypothetical protein
MRLLVGSEVCHNVEALMPQKARQQLIYPFAVGIILVWSLVTVVSLVTKDYQPLVIVTPVMLIATGFVFGVKRGSNGNGK